MLTSHSSPDLGKRADYFLHFRVNLIVAERSVRRAEGHCERKAYAVIRNLCAGVNVKQLYAFKNLARLIGDNILNLGYADRFFAHNREIARCSWEFGQRFICFFEI